MNIIDMIEFPKTKTKTKTKLEQKVENLMDYVSMLKYTCWETDAHASWTKERGYAPDKLLCVGSIERTPTALCSSFALIFGQSDGR